MKTDLEKLLEAVEEGAIQLVENKREDLLRAFEEGLAGREPKTPPEPPQVTVNSHNYMDVSELTEAVWKLNKIASLMLNQASEQKPVSFKPTINNPAISIDMTAIEKMMGEVKELLTQLLSRKREPRKFTITNDDGTTTTVEG